MLFWELYGANLDWDIETVLEVEVNRKNDDMVTSTRLDTKKATYLELPEEWKFYTVCWFHGTKVCLFTR